MRPIVPLLAACVLSPALVACGDDAGSGAGSDGPTVVASFYPLQYVAQQVAGDRAQVEALTSPGQEPHDLELTVGQTADLAGADVLLTLSGFQPSVDEAVEQNGPETVVDAADLVDLVPFDEPEAEEDHGDEHADEEHADEEGEHAEEEGEHEHGEGDLDPHFWLDPERLSRLASPVADALGEADPDNAQEYADRADDLVQRLTALDRSYEQGLADCEIDTVVVSHDAFGYLARYGLDVIGVAGVSPDAEPSPARLRDLAALIRETGVTTVFTETLASPAIARTLADEVGVETATLDPIEGLTDETASEDYESLMRENLDALRRAGSCR